LLIKHGEALGNQKAADAHARDEQRMKVKARLAGRRAAREVAVAEMGMLAATVEGKIEPVAAAELPSEAEAITANVTIDAICADIATKQRLVAEELAELESEYASCGGEAGVADDRPGSGAELAELRAELAAEREAQTALSAALDALRSKVQSTQDRSAVLIRYQEQQEKVASGLVSDRNAQRVALQAKLAQRKSDRDQSAAYIATLRQAVATIDAEAAAAAAAAAASGSGEIGTPSSPAQVQAELDREARIDRISRQCAATAESMQDASAEIARTQTTLAQIVAIAAADDAATAPAADGTAEADTQAFLEAELSVATSALADERASHNAVAAELAALVGAVELAGRGTAEAAVLRTARATGMDAAAVLIKHREAEQAVAVAKGRARHEQRIKMKVRIEQRRLAREEARQAFDDIGAKLSASAPDDATDGASAAFTEEAAAKREVALAAWSAAVQKRRTALAVELEETETEAATLWDTMAVGISTMRSTTFSQRVPTIASTPRYGSKINVITWQVALPRLMRLLVGSSASPTSLPRMLP
jgi:hypothetical protein